MPDSGRTYDVVYVWWIQGYQGVVHSEPFSFVSGIGFVPFEDTVLSD